MVTHPSTNHARRYLTPSMDLALDEQPQAPGKEARDFFPSDFFSRIQQISLFIIMLGRWGKVWQKHDHGRWGLVMMLGVIPNLRYAGEGVDSSVTSRLKKKVRENGWERGEKRKKLAQVAPREK